MARRCRTAKGLFKKCGTKRAKTSRKGRRSPIKGKHCTKIVRRHVKGHTRRVCKKFGR